jgi:3-deoxy-7-phosphoheptulonate synthase
MVEVHNDPEKALSDGPQALLPDQFEELMAQVKAIAEVIGRKM